MFCKNCGANIKPGNRFCIKCGCPVETDNAFEIDHQSKTSRFQESKNTGCLGSDFRFYTSYHKKTHRKFLCLLVVCIGMGVVLCGVTIAVTRDKKTDSSDDLYGRSGFTYESDDEHVNTSEIAKNTDSNKSDTVDTFAKNEETSNSITSIEADASDNNNNEEYNMSELSYALSEDADMKDDIYTNEQEYALHNAFGIDTDTIEDYSANLDPSKYLFYNSGIGEFYFYYPNCLFNDVHENNSPFSDEYGNNIRTVIFYGSAGSQLQYSLYSRTDNKSISEITDWINQNEHKKYYDISDILVKTDDEKGCIVLIGIMDSNQNYRVYDLIKIDDNYLYRMLSVKPHYYTEEERLQYAYVTENEYRMCGFSGSSQKARTYDEFLESDP